MRNYTYKAFISYRHMDFDKKIAEKLQKMLESFKPSGEFRHTKEPWRVFRDETELPTSSDLSDDIRTALKESEYLIVICSPDTPKSRWCLEEIAQFKALHGNTTENIISLLIDGEPSESFPSELCRTVVQVRDEHGNEKYQEITVEPLAANISSDSERKAMRKLKTEFLRIAAPLLGCGYDDLYNRRRRSRKRRMTVTVAAAFSVVLLFAMYSNFMLMQIYHQRDQLRAKNEELELKTQELNTSNEHLEEANEELDQSNADLDKTNIELKQVNEKLDQSNTELSDANKNLDITNSELEKSNLSLQKKTQEAQVNYAEANEQRRIAEINLNEANHQRAAAEANLEEADYQKSVAEASLEEANHQKSAAEKNMAEAEKQRGIAEANLREADKQKTIAEKNMTIAQDNEERANITSRDLRIKNSELLARQAQMYYDKDNINQAIETSIESLAQLSEAGLSSNPAAEQVLADASGAYKSEQKMLCRTVGLPGYVSFLEFAEDGRHILAEDSTGNIYIIDYETNKIDKTYSPYELFGRSSNSRASDISVDKNTAYILSNSKLTSIDLTNERVNWICDKIYGTEIITNTAQDQVFIPLTSGYKLISKEGVVLYDNPKVDEKYSFDYKNKAFMDNKGRSYTTNIKDNSVYQISANGSEAKRYELPADNYECVLSIGEDEESIFVNCLTDNENDPLCNKQARLICLNKSDMSVKWETVYNGDNMDSYMFNGIYNKKIRPINDSGERYDADVAAVICGYNINAFEKQSGKVLFHVVGDYDDSFLYYESKEPYIFQAATRKKYYKQAVLSFGENGEQSVIFLGAYAFDKDRKYIAHAGEDNFALASADSSEIDLYHRISYDSGHLLTHMPERQLYTDSKTADNGNGIWAAHSSEYTNVPDTEDKQRHDHITIYDVNNDKLLSDKEVDIKVSEMIFLGDKLFIADNDGTAEILDCNGAVYKKLDLAEIFREQNGIAADTYLSFYSPHLAADEDSLMYCLDKGIISIHLTDGGVDAETEYYKEKGYMSEQSHSGGLLTFLESADGTYKIAYTRSGSRNISYVQNEGHDAVYGFMDISKLITSDKEGRIAFIKNNDGYIGIYKCGDPDISRIAFDRSDAVPVEIRFSPDGKYILALCANGELIKYSVETLSETAKMKVDQRIYSTMSYTFIDDSSFYIKNSSDLSIVDFDSMMVKANISNVIYFMNNDKKFLYKRYTEKGEVYGYYNYLTTNELIEHGKAFLNNNR